MPRITENPSGTIARATLRQPDARDARDKALWAAAQKLEVNFLAEMLKSTGLGQSQTAMGGGVGEEQFGSFLRTAQAELMVKKGGVGLAQSLFEALKDRANGHI